MQQNKHRVAAHDGSQVDVTEVSEHEVVLQLATATGFARIKRTDEGMYRVTYFNTPKVFAASYSSAARMALQLLRKETVELGEGDRAADGGDE